MTMQHMAPSPDTDTAPQAPHEIFQRIRVLLRMRGAFNLDGIARAYMAAAGHPAVGGGMANLLGMHRDQIVHVDEPRRSTGGLTRTEVMSGVGGRHSGGLDAVLVAMARDRSTPDWIAHMMPWLRFSGAMLVMMPMSEFQSTDPRLLVPAFNTADPDASWLSRVQAYRMPALRLPGIEPDESDQTVLIRGVSTRHAEPGDPMGLRDPLFVVAREWIGRDAPRVEVLKQEVLDALHLPAHMGHVHPQAQREVRNGEMPAYFEHFFDAYATDLENGRRPFLIEMADVSSGKTQMRDAARAAEARLRAVSWLSEAQRDPKGVLPHIWRSPNSYEHQDGRIVRVHGSVRFLGGKEFGGEITPATGGRIQTTFTMEAPESDDPRGKGVFARPLPSREAAAAAALRAGTFARADVRNALETGLGTLVRSLESPAMGQLAQMMAVLPFALLVEREGRPTLFAVHAVEKFKRDTRFSEERGDWEITEGASLVMVGTMLDVTTGEITHMDDEELHEVQMGIAGQLLDEIRGALDVTMPTAALDAAWEGMLAALPDEHQDNPLERELWGEQRRVVITCATALLKFGASLLVGEQGVGKTTMILSLIRMLNLDRATVVTPPGVIPEWMSDLAEVIPHADALTVRRPAELAAVPSPRRGHPQIVFIPDSVLSNLPNTRRAAVLRGVLHGEGEIVKRKNRAACPKCGKVIWDTARGDHRWFKGRAQTRQRCTGKVTTARTHGGDVVHETTLCDEPLWQFSEVHGLQRDLRDGVPVGVLPFPDRKKRVEDAETGTVEVVPDRPKMVDAGSEVRKCAACGWHRLSEAGDPLSARTATRGTCPACDADLAASGAVVVEIVDRRPASLADAWVRYGFSSELLVLDEMHRFKGSNTSRGVEAGRLMGLVDKTLLASATVTNGTASSLYHILARLTPGLRKRFPTERAFVAAFGMSQDTYRLRAHDGRDDDLRSTHRKSREVEGLHPMILPVMLPLASFISHVDVLGHDTEWSESLVLSELPEDPVEFANLRDHPEEFGRFVEDVVHPAAERAIAGVQDNDPFVTATVAAEWAAFEAYLQGAPDDDLPAGGRARFDTAALSEPSPRGRYEELSARLRGDGRRRRRGQIVHAQQFFPDTWTWRGEVLTSVAGHPIAWTPPAVNTVSPKEQALIDVVIAERDAGRRSLIFVEGMYVRDVAGRLMSLLTEAGVKTDVVRASKLQAGARKAWIAHRAAKGVEALISHPNSIGVGMNLQVFPTVVVYEINKSSNTMRQATMRGRRVNQTQDVRHVYVVTRDTGQETELLRDASAALSASPLQAGDSSPDRFMHILGKSSVPAQMTGFELLNVLRGHGGDPALTARLREAADRVAVVAEHFGYTPDTPLSPEELRERGMGTLMREEPAVAVVERVAAIDPAADLVEITIAVVAPDGRFEDGEQLSFLG